MESLWFIMNVGFDKLLGLWNEDLSKTIEVLWIKIWAPIVYEGKRKKERKKERKIWIVVGGHYTSAIVVNNSTTNVVVNDCWVAQVYNQFASTTIRSWTFSSCMSSKFSWSHSCAFDKTFLNDYNLKYKRSPNGVLF
jgi:hypothetical protein